MNVATASSSHIASQVLRLGQFIRWALITASFFTLIDILIRVLTPNWLDVLNIVGDGLLIGSLVLAWALVQRQRISQAVWLVCGTLWGFSLILVLTDPWNFTPTIFIPLLAVISVLAYVERVMLRWLSIGGVLITVLAFFLATQVRLDPTIAEPEGSQFQNIGGLVAVAGLCFFVLGQFHLRLNETLQETQRTNEELRQSQAALETQVQARTSELQALLIREQERSAEMGRLLEENVHQRTTIRKQSVPVLPISERVLVMPIIGIVDSERLQDLQQEALSAAERLAARVLILDITGVVLVDRQVAQGLLSIVQALQLLGVSPWIVGIRPEVAQALVELQLDVSALRTASTLQDILPKVIN